jgi:S1-C subfamily serine protease
MKKRLILILGIFFLAGTIMACNFTGLIPTLTTVPLPTVPALPALPSSPPQTAANLADQQSRLMAIYQQYSPGVVSIRTSTAQGSGWVYSGDGYIVTNNHVVGSESQVEVDFSSGYKAYGEVVGTDAFADLAAVKVDVPPEVLHPLPIGDSESLQVGQTVIAIGNPFGYSGTMTIGIISALGRALTTENQISGGGFISNANIIQTDAALNPGNSGGPLLNLDGQVVGINYAIETNSYTVTNEPVNSGIGFAISINTVKRIIPSLIQFGSYDYPYLGITSQDDLPLELIQALDLKSTSGVYVLELTPGGPSEKAGILAGSEPLIATGTSSINKGGDLIVAIDGRPVVTYSDMIGYLYMYKSPGDSVVISVLRGEQKVDLTVVLGTLP